MTIELDKPEYLNEIMSTILGAGFQCYIIGGAVRDTLLGRTPKDFDVITDAKPYEIKTLFKKKKKYHCFQINPSYATVLVIYKGKQTVEVTSFVKSYRSENGPIWTDSLQEDLKQRDFTLNTMCIDQNGNLIDPLNGYEDLKNKELKTPQDPDIDFQDDPLRMLRYFRFIVSYGFNRNKDIEASITKNKELLKNVKAPRIAKELREILIHDPTIILDLHEIGLLEYMLKEVDDLFSVTQNSIYHYTDAGHHTMDALEYSKKHFTDLTDEKKFLVNFALLYHDTGKAKCKTTDEDGHDHFYRHAEISSNIAKVRLRKMMIGKKEANTISKIIFYHDITLAKTKRCFNHLSSKMQFTEEKARLLFKVMEADASAHINGEENIKEKKEIFSYLLRKYNKSDENFLCAENLEIKGETIMEIMNIPASEKVGEIKKMLFNEVLSGKLENNEKALRKRLEEISHDDESNEGNPQPLPRSHSR